MDSLSFSFDGGNHCFFLCSSRNCGGRTETVNTSDDVDSVEVRRMSIVVGPNGDSKGWLWQYWYLYVLRHFSRMMKKNVDCQWMQLWDYNTPKVADVLNLAKMCLYGETTTDDLVAVRRC